MVLAARCFAFRALITLACVQTSPLPQEKNRERRRRLLSRFFAKHLFAKQELITRARLRGQDFATGKNFSFNQCHTKSFACFSRESCFIKEIENFFPVFV